MCLVADSGGYLSQAALRTGASLVFLHDWWVLIPEVIACLEEREEALDVVHMLEEELREKQAAAAKISAALGPVASADKRLAALNASIQTLTVSSSSCCVSSYIVCVSLLFYCFDVHGTVLTHTAGT